MGKLTSLIMVKCIVQKSQEVYWHCCVALWSYKLKLCRQITPCPLPSLWLPAFYLTLEPGLSPHLMWVEPIRYLFLCGLLTSRNYQAHSPGGMASISFLLRHSLTLEAFLSEAVCLGAWRHLWSSPIIAAYGVNDKCDTKNEAQGSEHVAPSQLVKIGTFQREKFPSGKFLPGNSCFQWTRLFWCLKRKGKGLRKRLAEYSVNLHFRVICKILMTSMG
jgi:hypothetical protein